MTAQVPSKTIDDDWIRAKSPRQFTQTGRIGKWMIFPLKEHLDDIWPKIAKATEAEQLGIAANTSTDRTNPNSVSPKTGLVCVYSYDSDDVADVKRVLEQLRALGFNDRLNYKEDEQTLQGNYGSGVSLFTSPPDSRDIMHPKKWTGRRLV